mmetsp:Transcript_6734/g.16535  ORF Transcript_6734/g.16535 Transcript_6734/m.16535 type:complete len:119 (+) Transcript_6734:192-548(+)|eukprot:CAMPEP_0197173586 /NCGR_PEP_ID=MMETSP1423-20130617/461_1 /TAXON_ID=476441 /ORGANISM="Pseudo-nitzschia heimii, Strain UNC1101" /LENGTH=118 /DNA_ID=CAMNT_0042622421 /DNA_START=150 /DNA_END=506 /DNA_ORIENTATION=-
MTNRYLLILALALCAATGTHGFVPSKKKTADRHAAFRNEKDSNKNGNEEETHTATTTTQTHYQPATSHTAAFSIPPNAAMVAALYEYEDEDEEVVSYEVALVSCIVSLAIGFGTGYLV